MRINASDQNPFHEERNLSEENEGRNGETPSKDFGKDVINILKKQYYFLRMMSFWKIDLKIERPR
jgi:hypothetical protein